MWDDDHDDDYNDDVGDDDDDDDDDYDRVEEEGKTEQKVFILGVLQDS